MIQRRKKFLIKTLLGKISVKKNIYFQYSWAIRTISSQFLSCNIKPRQKKKIIQCGIL